MTTIKQWEWPGWRMGFRGNALEISSEGGTLVIDGESLREIAMAMLQRWPVVVKLQTSTAYGKCVRWVEAPPVPQLLEDPEDVYEQGGAAQRSRELRPFCKTGIHGFSWREAGQACCYCGEPPQREAGEVNRHVCGLAYGVFDGRLYCEPCDEFAPAAKDLSAGSD